MQKRIEDIHNKSCYQLIDDLNTIAREAEETADILAVEIRKSYEARDQADMKAHDAAESKDLDAYRNARVKYDMLTEFISSAEQRRDQLMNGSLLDQRDAVAIRRRMRAECHNIEGNAAVSIQNLLSSMREAQRDAEKEFETRNAVIVALNECERLRDQNGELKQIFDGIYKDTIIDPYLKDIEGINSIKAASFKIFADSFKNSTKD